MNCEELKKLLESKGYQLVKSKKECAECIYEIHNHHLMPKDLSEEFYDLSSVILLMDFNREVLGVSVSMPLSSEQVMFISENKEPLMELSKFFSEMCASYAILGVPYENDKAAIFLEANGYLHNDEISPGKIFSTIDRAVLAMYWGAPVILEKAKFNKTKSPPPDKMYR